MFTPVLTTSEESIARSAGMGKRQVRVTGKCRLCERARTKSRNPVLRYWSENKYGLHYLKCTICGAIWFASTKKDVMEQVKEN
ncbi:hypothetical protein LCGC14_3082400 [marine sediment metagenome]|uniref:Uncharacterized protein n=1 Tax=marine sediment metagenome TaxID=412755 RepID=A0A0F8Z3L2_9ZZZZ